MPGCLGGPASPGDTPAIPRCPPPIPQGSPSRIPHLSPVQKVVLAAMARRIETGSIDIDAIKDQFPLADEVRRHLTLKRRGSTLVGLCPFHMERTPSFAVYPDEQRYHCFGCGAHGDIFDFLHAQEGLDIRAAAERLTGGNFPVLSEARVLELRARQARFEAEQAERRKLGQPFTPKDYE